MPFSLPTPAAARADVREHHRVRGQVAHELPGRRPVVVRRAVDAPRLARAAVVAVAAVRAVEPDLEHVAVVREQLGDLRAEDLRHVLRGPVERAVAVPRGHVHAEREAGALRGRPGRPRRRRRGPSRHALAATECPVVAVGHRQKPSWCLAVRITPRNPACASVPTIWSGSKSVGAKTSGDSSP